MTSPEFTFLWQVGHDPAKEFTNHWWNDLFNKTAANLPCSSAGKESACHAGDPVRFLGQEDPPGERIGYPPQYSWATLVGH